jgi:hypothetical protein
MSGKAFPAVQHQESQKRVACLDPHGSLSVIAGLDPAIQGRRDWIAGSGPVMTGAGRASGFDDSGHQE